MYPTVSLENYPLDKALAQRLPLQLAYYHLALPIGIDEEGITVAMAQPENRKAREVIQAVLNTPIIPVRSEAEQIRHSLDMLWQASPPVHWKQIISQSDDEVSLHYVREFARVYNCPIQQSDHNPSENALFIHRITDSPLSNFVSSTLLVDRVTHPIKRILHLVRVHTPDQAIIHRLIPLAKAHESYFTLLPDTGIVAFNLAYLIDAQSSYGQHLTVLRQQLSFEGVNGQVRLRQGSFIDVLKAELSAVSYDMVAVAADAYGETVELLTHVIQQYHIPTVLVIKPDLETV